MTGSASDKNRSVLFRRKRKFSSGIIQFNQCAKCKQQLVILQCQCSVVQMCRYAPTTVASISKPSTTALTAARTSAAGESKGADGSHQLPFPSVTFQPPGVHSVAFHERFLDAGSRRYSASHSSRSSPSAPSIPSHRDTSSPADIQEIKFCYGCGPKPKQ